ncbi:MAG: TauD/TfdA family dioxygenase [Gammaproteobacteria bacterium]|nr:TauD/TfdA family dioxygenase [Gammaproteobacteria bacterium]
METSAHIINLRPLSRTFGAELLGVDLLAEHDPEVIDAVRKLWREHKLLLFRGQKLDEEHLVRFSRHFGPLEIHLRREYLSKKHPEVLLVSNVKESGKKLGILADREVGWHYDQIYLQRPAVGSLLFSVKIPPAGGNTYFADMHAAYESLPEETKNQIRERHAIQSYEAFNRVYSEPTSREQKEKTPDVSHPMVRTHPYTGRKALYICPGMTTRIVGMPEDESDALLRELFDWCTRPEFVYTHEWREGDALLWDNACTMHRRDPFDSHHDRLLKRTTILPDPEKAKPF